LGRYIERIMNAPAIPAEVMEVLREDVRTQRRDKYGVRNVNLIFTKDGHLFCVVDSPTVDALLVSHNGKGIPVERKDVHEIIQVMADYFGAANITSQG
jgi:(2Fe-2S) ferredoxin